MLFIRSIFYAAAGLVSLGASACASPLDTSNVTFAMIPGAFHVADALDTIGSLLQADGYNVRVYGLVTVNNAALTIQQDQWEIQGLLLDPLIQQQGRDVLLYCHSYSGFPCSQSIQGSIYSKQARLAAGKSGGIIGIIYQSAFIPRPGQTLLQMIGGKYAPWQQPTANGLVNVINPQQVFYQDVANQKLAAQAARQIYPQSTKSFNTPEGTVYYTDSEYNNRRAYFMTAQDQALPPAAQSAYLANSTTTWDVTTLQTGHSPWLSQPSMLAQLIVTKLQQFAATY